MNLLAINERLGRLSSFLADGGLGSGPSAKRGSLVGGKLEALNPATIELLLHLRSYFNGSQPILNDHCIRLIVHRKDNLVPDEVVNWRLVVLDLVEHLVHEQCCLQWVLLRDLRFDHVFHIALHLQYVLPELFVDFVAQNLAEEQNIVILYLVLVNGADNGIDLVDDERFETVLLVQVSVQELLHGLPVLVVHSRALFVVLLFLRVYV